MTYGSLYWKNIEFTWDDDSVNYFIIINEPFEDTYYIPEKTIIINNKINEINKINEVNQFKNNLDSNKFMKIIPFNESYKYTIWNIPENYIELSNNIIKKDLNNIYFNGENQDFINHLKNNNLIQNKCLKSCKYSIVLENISNLYDAILSECICFVNISMKDLIKDISKEVIIFININNIKESIKIINNSMINDLWESKIDFIKKEKNNILNNINFCNNIEKLIFYPLYTTGSK
jgi:hypothetical protein